MHLLFRFVLSGDHFEIRYNFDSRINVKFLFQKTNFSQETCEQNL